MTFRDLLEIELKLTIGGVSHAIPGANVKALDLDLESYGFRAAVELVLIDDQAQGGHEQDHLLSDFVKPDLLEVELSVQPRYRNPEAKASVPPIAVKGIATCKRLEENADPTHKDRAILWRRYRIELADPAAVLWTQHFPCELFTKKSMKDVIDAHKGAKISVTYGDWQALTTEAPLLFLNLPPELGASFYDFVAWYVDGRAGHLTYDHAENEYRFASAKSTEGEPADIFGDDVARVVADLPPIARCKRNVLNSYAEAAATKPIDNAQAVDGIRQDYLVRTPIAQRLDDRAALEQSRMQLRTWELDVEFARWPTITTVPGARIQFVASNLWSAQALQIGKTWRVIRQRVRVRASDPKADAWQDQPEAPYEVEMSARLEQDDDPTPRLPDYATPAYPGYVEGKVVSEQGDDTDVTYQYYSDDQTSLDEYQVTIPLWSDQKITAPYDPHQGSGKMYIPLYKGARVLLALGLEDATIARLLSWREGVRMAMDAQGEQLFFGKKATAGTMVNHAYEDSKPVFKIARANEKDKATIQIKEGVLTLEVREDS